MIVLGIETSCDETAVAIVELKGPAPSARLLVNLIASQHEIHTPYGGIVPELASRRHIEVLQPLVEQALQQAGIPLKKIDGVAATFAPGLVGSLLVGLSFAKSLAFGLNKPFLGVSHLEGHLNAPLLEHPRLTYPQIGLIVSGGHTALYMIKKFGDYQFLGGTRDDAAGEAFDKAAKLLGLGYPGGPIIDRLAKEGDPTAMKLPRPSMPKYDFSFSGLKTAVRYVLEGSVIQQKALGAACHSSPTISQAARAQATTERRVSEVDRRFLRENATLQDMCASFQETVVDHLIEKTMKAAQARRCKTVVLTGGVACNSRLREKLGEQLKKTGRQLVSPSPQFCTDNAAMIAYVGGRYLQQGFNSSLNLNAHANLDLSSPVGVGFGERVQR